MTNYPGIGALLRLVADRREVEVDGLSEQTGIPVAEIRLLLDGGKPSSSVLRQLAPVVGLHIPDVYAIAQVPLPDELAPLDSRAGQLVPQIVQSALSLSPALRSELRQSVQALPQYDRTQPVKPAKPYEQYPPSVGAALVGMLVNRNLTWSHSAKVLYHLTDVLFSAATIGQIGHGNKALTPDLLAAFSTVLGIELDYLSALQLADPGKVFVPNPAAADIAELIWDLRRLTVEQATQVNDEAKSMAGQQ